MTFTGQDNRGPKGMKGQGRWDEEAKPEQRQKPTTPNTDLPNAPPSAPTPE